MTVLDESILGQVDAANAAHREQSEALWAMTPEQRAAAMWGGELTHDQLYEWAKQAPEEVPHINGEFAFVALNMPEVAELQEERAR